MDGRLNKYPCNTCIVQALCQEICVTVLEFCNDMTEKLFSMSAAEIRKYRMTTPSNIKQTIEVLIKTNSRFATHYVDPFKTELIPNGKLGV